MKLFFKQTKESVIFRVSNFNPEYKDALIGGFYTLKGEIFEKEYKKEEIFQENIPSIKRNFLKYGEEMFAQMAYLKPPLWQEGLIGFMEKVRGKNIDWWLTGSCALAIRGIEVTPHDVDIMLKSKDIDKIMDIFQHHMIEPLSRSDDWIVKHFSVLFLKTRVDLAFDPLDILDDPEPSDSGPFAAKNLEEISWKGHKIKVPPLHLQLNTNKKRGRKERVRLIEEYLGENEKKP